MNDKIEADKSLQNTKHSKLVVPTYEIMIKDLYRYIYDRRDSYK